MKTIFTSLALASALAAGTAGATSSQLIANAGLTVEEAADMSLSAIAALKFNRDSDGDNQQRLPARQDRGRH